MDLTDGSELVPSAQPLTAPVKGQGRPGVTPDWGMQIYVKKKKKNLLCPFCSLLQCLILCGYLWGGKQMTCDSNRTLIPNPVLPGEQRSGDSGATSREISAPARSCPGADPAPASAAGRMQKLFSADSPDVPPSTSGPWTDRQLQDRHRTAKLPAGSRYKLGRGLHELCRTFRGNPDAKCCTRLFSL